MPTGVHQLWEIGWNDDGTQPAGITQCDHYQTIANLDGTFTGNSKSTFVPLSLEGTIDGVTGLRGMALRVRMFNDQYLWWSYFNIDNISLDIVSLTSPYAAADFDRDGDVDADDFAHLQSCLTGPAVIPVPASCQDADLDGD